MYEIHLCFMYDIHSCFMYEVRTHPCVRGLIHAWHNFLEKTTFDFYWNVQIFSYSYRKIYICFVSENLTVSSWKCSLPRHPLKHQNEMSRISWYKFECKHSSILICTQKSEFSVFACFLGRGVFSGNGHTYV